MNLKRNKKATGTERSKTWAIIRKALDRGNPTINVLLPCFGQGRSLVHVTVLVHEDTEAVRSQVQQWLWDIYCDEGTTGIFKRTFEDYYGRYPQIEYDIMLFSIKR